MRSPVFQGSSELYLFSRQGLAYEEQRSEFYMLAGKQWAAYLGEDDQVCFCSQRVHINRRQRALFAPECPFLAIEHQLSNKPRVHQDCHAYKALRLSCESDRSFCSPFSTAAILYASEQSICIFNFSE